MRPPIRHHTADQYEILAIVGAAGFLGSGAYVIIAALRAPEEKQALADQALQAGFLLVAMGLISGFLIWLYRRAA